MAGSDCKVYVGNLGDNTSKKELEDVFFKYGPITNIWVARNPPGFAFVEFEDPRDAKDAIRALDGTRCCGTRLLVELSNGGRSRRNSASSGTTRRRASPPRRSRSKSPWRKGSRSRSRSRSRSFTARRSRSLSPSPGGDNKKDDANGGSNRYREWDLSCKVYVGNLLNNASKNELEDVFSKYGPIKNVWVARNPPGFAFIEFEDPRDAEDAVRGLDGMRCCGTRIIVEMSNGKSRRSSNSRRRSSPYSRKSRSRSPWRRSSRQRSRSPRSRSRSTSPLTRRDRSRSFSRERR